jgi:hypothetical protein
MRMPHLVVCDTLADGKASAKAIMLPPSGSHLQTRWYLRLLLLRCRQCTVQELFFRSWTSFCTPWTGSAISASTAAVPIPSAVTATEVGSLTSPPAGRRQSSGVALLKPVLPASACNAVHVGTAPLVSTPVHTPYINAYLFWNKPVLSYLLLCLLPQYIGLVMIL